MDKQKEADGNVEDRPVEDRPVEARPDDPLPNQSGDQDAGKRRDEDADEVVEPDGSRKRELVLAKPSAQSSLQGRLKQSWPVFGPTFSTMPLHPLCRCLVGP